MEQNQTSDQKNTKGKTLHKIIDWTLLTTLIIVVLYASIKGHYTDVKIIEICNGIPVNDTYTFNLTKLI